MSDHHEITQELRKLIKQTNKAKPAKKDLQALRQFLRDRPELWRITGDMAEQSIRHLSNTMGENSALLRESLETGCRQLQKELGMDSDTLLEELLIQQVVMAWLRLTNIEFQYTGVTGGEQLIRRVDHWERRLNAAQRRFFRACETLARIRKLNVPMIQVNIGQQQVNQVNR